MHYKHAKEMKRIALLLLLTLGIFSGKAQHILSLLKERVDELRITAQNNASSPSYYRDSRILLKKI